MARTWTALALTLAAACAAAAAFAQSVEPPAALGDAAALASEPCVALAPNGRVGCAWVSAADGRQAVVFRERIGPEAWSAPARFESEVGARPASPVLLYDSSSNPRLIWRDGPAGRGHIDYASRYSGLWLRHDAISDNPRADVADPAAAFGGAGRLYAAWRVGSGSFWRVEAATMEADGSARRFDLTADQPERLNLYPTVLPDGTILWFSETDAGVGLEARRYDPARGAWAPAAPSDLSALPRNRLPCLFGGGIDLICAVWFNEVAGLDRIFFGLSGPVARGAGALVDDNSAGPNTQPFGVLTPGGLPVLCWRAQTAAGPAIFVRKRAQDVWLPAAVLSLPEPPYPARPRVAADDQAAHVVWTSESDDGGTGNVFYSAARWQ
ncbi:MAG: hypothetical protein NTW86_04975 [Candidatus Sumerlaeota bacterium]|nr:hypothetical protein [Candidatus Sumerlaeota bacterium]